MEMFLLQILVFGGLAAGATRMSWRNPMGVVGLALLMCWFITSIGFFGTSLASRVALEICQAVLLVSAARLAYAAKPSWPPLLVVILSTIDIAFCASLIYPWVSPAWQEYVFCAVTNALFVLQCAIVASPGARDAIVDYLHRRADRRLVGSAYRARDVSGDAS